MKLKNFKVHEFVPKEVYDIRGEKSIYLMDKHLLNFIDKLRDYLGKPITANNWKWGGKFSYRGLRTPASKYYSQWSQHTYGRGLDFDVEGMSAEEVRQWIIANRDLEWVKPISFIESDVNWVHVDVRCVPDNQLWVWSVITKDTKIYRRNL